MRKIKKFLLINFFFLFCFSTISYSEILKKFNVQGNDRLSDQTIAIFGDINIDQNYDADDVNLIIKKLYETNFFSDIKIDFTSGILNITVVENPIINLIIFKGVKAEKYKKQIIELLELREKTPFVKNSVKKDIAQIRRVYRHLGHYFVKVEAEVQQLEKNRVNLVYSLDIGEKAKIAKIFFLGDKKVRDKRLRAIVTSEEHKFWKFLSKNVFLNEGRVELDKRLLKNYYKNRGYYEVQISSSNVEYIEGKGFILTFSINAGKRFRFGKIFANVSESLKKAEFFALDTEFKKIIGEYYSQKRLGQILERIDELAERKELQFVNHSVKETLDGDKVIVQIDIIEGRKTFIERINVVGNNVTNEAVIRGELIVDEGDPFSELLVNKSINKIKARNLFGSVKYKILPGSKPNNSIIEIEVEEKPTGEIAAGAGVGTEGTSFNFYVTENNWLGRGVRVKASADITEESIRGAIDVTNPNYNYSGNAVSASFSSIETDRLATSGYKSTKTSFSLGTSFEQYRNIFISPKIGASYENIRTDSSASAALQRMDGQFTNIDLGYGITNDKRNQPFQPSDGSIIRFTQSIPLYSDTPSLSNEAEYATYHMFTEDVIGAFKLYGKTVNSLDADEDVRVSNRVFLPSKRLRGFKRGKVGPKDGDDHIGGNYASSINFEAALPNFLPEESKTDVMIFLDAANLWGVDYDSTIASSDTWRSSFGASANMYTPVGPLTMTLSQPISKTGSDVTETFTFRIGTSF